MDKPSCRPEEVYEMVFDLMCELNATEDQLDFPVVVWLRENGWMAEDWKQPTDNIDYLLDKIVEIIPARSSWKALRSCSSPRWTTATTQAA